MDGGEAAARERVEAAYAAIDGLDREALTWTALPTRDPEDRARRLAALERAVDAAGRGGMLDDARGWLREALAHRISARGRLPESGIWGTSDVGPAEDIAAVVLALDDFVAVAVALDLIDPEDASVLAAPGQVLLGLEPLGAATSAAADPTPGRWEPSAEDWAAAEAWATGGDDEEDAG